MGRVFTLCPKKRVLSFPRTHDTRTHTQEWTLPSSKPLPLGSRRVHSSSGQRDIQSSHTQKHQNQRRRRRRGFPLPKTDVAQKHSRGGSVGSRRRVESYARSTQLKPRNRVIWSLIGTTCGPRWPSTSFSSTSSLVSSRSPLASRSSMMSSYF